MTLSETSEARIRGYLYLLQQSLESFLPKEVVRDSVREVESHVRERFVEKREKAEKSEAGLVDERECVEEVLRALGSPLELSKVYAAEIAIDDALSSGGLVSVWRALGRAARITLGSFFKALASFAGYAASLAFFVIAVTALFFPESVGLLIVNGLPVAYGTVSNLPEGSRLLGGYWNVPIGAALGVFSFWVTHRLTRRWLKTLRERLGSSEGRARPA